MTETMAPPTQVSIFADFLDEEVYLIGQFSEQLAVPAGQDVFVEGTTDRSLFVVIEGDLAALIRTADGGELEVGRIHTGDVFGELSFLDGLPRTAAVRALSDSLLLRLSRERFDQMQGDYPLIAAKLLGDLALVLALRLRAADQMIASLGKGADA